MPRCQVLVPGISMVFSSSILLYVYFTMSIADKLLILNEAASGYLTRLSYHRTILNDPNHDKYPTISLGLKEYDKIRKIINKKWPEVQSENLTMCNNYPNFVNQASDIKRELNDMYRTFCLVHDWFPKTQTLLRTLLTDKINVDIVTAQFTFTQILTLITNHVKLSMMLHKSAAEYKLVTSLFSHACLAMTDMTSETVQYKFLSQLLTRLSNTTITIKIEQDFQLIAPHIGKLLLSLQPIYQKLTNLHGMDSSGTLDIINSDNISYPSLKHDLTYRQSLLYDNIREWTIIGYLTCPCILIDTLHMDWLSTMLKDGWMLHIHRNDIIISCHSIWSEMFSWYPKKNSGIKFPKIDSK